MRQLWSKIRYTPFMIEFLDFFKKGDLILLSLCLLTSGFGCLIVASTNNYRGFTRYVAIQLIAIVLGVFLYMVVSSISADFISEHRRFLIGFNCFMLILLLTPFGTAHNSGNRSWLEFPFLPMDIQPAEFCKITFVVILASTMASHQNRISSLRSVFHMVFQLGLVAGMNVVISGDAGVSLIFVFIFIIMAFAGGVKWYWFAIGGGGIAACIPILWNYIMQPYQKERILVLFDPSIDPYGLDARYQSYRSLLSLNGGGLTGQGLFNGNRTQVGALPAQHTDFIFSALGEEMGYLGCLLVICLLLLIIARCVWVGTRSQDYLRRMMCFGVAAALIFQMVSNVGMCLGVTPVIGLTLPFISYGGSSMMSLFAMMGLVSGVHARPEPKSHERYIHAPAETLRWY